MMKRTLVALVALLGFAAAACSPHTGQKQTAGTILGGVGGAVAGSQFGSGRGQLVAVGAGTLLGAFLGGEIGKSLDRADQIQAQQTATRALESNPVGETSTWRNPDSGNSGTVTPTRTYQQADGQYCREYQQTIFVGGRTEEAFGTACRQPDGSWRVVSS